MAAATIEVRYKCACMPAEVGVAVPFRRDDEDIGSWMEQCVGSAIYLDHRRRSPLCVRTSCEYAKLPAPENAPFLGAKPQVN